MKYWAILFLVFVIVFSNQAYGYGPVVGDDPARFDVCLQDETNPGNVVLVNTSTGDYSFCCGGVPIASGRGTLNIKGGIGSIDNAKGDRRVHIQWDTSANNNNGEGTAIVQKLSDKIVCQITDKNMSNNSCSCGGATWNPPNISQQILAGTTLSVPVSFITDVPLSNVRANSSPQLAQFAIISPTFLDTVPSGLSQTLTILLTIPKNTPIGIITGDIVLVSADNPSKIFGPPLPVMIDIQQATPSEIPAGVALPSPDRVVTEPELNVPFAKDEIDIVFKDGTPQTTVLNLVSQIGGGFLGSIPEINLYQVQVLSEGFENLSNLINLAQQSSNVVFAIHHFLGNTATFPNDPGTDFSYAPDLINLPSAWDLTTGSKNFSIAIVDQGFGPNHPDLRDNVIKQTPNAALLTNHGTRVASIVGAKGNNGIGIAGVMWNAILRLYSAGSPTEPNALDQVLLGSLLLQAINDGSRVVNLSWAIECESNNCTQKEQQTLHEIDTFIQQFINIAKSKNKDILWVFAAGNKGVNVRNSSPAGLAPSNVVSVSAVNNQKRLMDSVLGKSNYGRDITVAAPGVDIYSDIVGGGFNNGTFADSASGTSFAAPHVTGVAGLMLSVNSNLTAEVLKVIIKYGASDTGHRDAEGNEVFLLDAFRAVQSAQAAFRFPDGSYLVTVAYPSSRLPDQFPSDFPLEEPGNLVTQNYVAAATDGRFQQTRVFVTTRKLDNAIAIYRNYFLTHGWTILNDVGFPNLKVLLARKPGGRPSDLMQVNIDENDITHVRSISLNWTPVLN